MNFSRLPDIVFLKIFEYLPSLEDRLRAGHVDTTFRRIAQLAISRTKSLDLAGYRFENLSEDQLAVILDLCSPNLERIVFPSRDTLGTPPKTASIWGEDPFQQASILINHGGKLATMFANYECPRLIDIDLGEAPIDAVAFNRLIRNNPNVESLIWKEILFGFLNVSNENLKKLTLYCYHDANVQSIIGRFPNLKELELRVSIITVANVLDQVFVSMPHVHRLGLKIDEFDGGHDVKLEKELVNLWNLPLTSLNIRLPETLEDDDILYKVASSFPNLNSFGISSLKTSSDGIEALAVLQDLEILELPIFRFGHDDFEQGLCQFIRCKKLRKLVIKSLSIRAGILITLLRGCPQLNHIEIWEIDDVDNPDEAVELLEGLLGTQNRDSTIKFQSDQVVWLKSIWETESVKEMIKALEENDGLKITFGLREIPKRWHLMEDDSSDP